MNTCLTYDPGYGNIKLFALNGGFMMQSAVSVGDSQRVGRMLGLRAVKPPLRIETDAGVFHVGPRAHDWGRPVENLDFERLAGSPEMMALFYGALSQYGVPHDPIDLVVGLPIHVLMDEDTKAIQQAARRALSGAHTWAADGREQSVLIEAVRITSQPVGAMFDYLLDDEGQMSLSRQVAFRGEIGILGIGMNTMDLLVVRGGAPVQRFTAGDSLGVRRLLELAKCDGTYSLAERDAMLRQGSLQLAEARSIWQSEVLGFIEKQWGSAFRRYDIVVAAGGGTLILRDVLMRRFKEKLHVPEDPIIATARGLFKYSLLRAQRAKHE